MIKQININDYLELKYKANKEGILFCKKTIYYGIEYNNEIVAIGGILHYENKNIIKNLYVLKNHRGKGYFKKMVDFLINLETNKKLEANCTKYSIKYFLEKGFKVELVYKNKIVKVTK